MVLPEPVAHPAPDHAVGWLDQIALTLRLASGAALVLINKAHPARLGDLVRTLRHDFPAIDVIPDVGKLVDVAPGSTIVLTPVPEDAEWLNLRRGQFAERKLKVVFFCDEATTRALKFRAPDFYDWIGRQKDCPPGPVPFAVRGIRAAFDEGWPVAWKGSGERAAVEEVVRVACPEEEIAWLPSDAPFEKMVGAMQSPGIVLALTDTPRRLRRAQWAKAAARRTTRIVFVVGREKMPGFWPVDDAQMPLAEAYAMLAEAGARVPGRLAAMVDLEPDAVKSLARWLGVEKERSAMDELVAALDPGFKATEPPALVEALAELDPGAAVARVTLAPQWTTKHSIESHVAQLLSEGQPLEFRAIARRTPVRRALTARLERREHVSEIEKVLQDGHDDHLDILLKSAIDLAKLGDADVLASTLRSVKDTDIQEAIRPVLPQLARERDPETQIELMRSVVQGLRARWQGWYARRETRLRGARYLLLIAAGSLSLEAGCAAAFTLVGTWVLIPAAVVTMGLLVAAARVKSIMRADEEALVWPWRAPKWLLDLESLLPPTRAEREAYIRRRVLASSEKVEEEDLAEAESIARDAMNAATELKDPALKQLAACALASTFLAQARRTEALRIVEPFFGEDVAFRSKDLLALTVRLLAETGRAADAARALLHLTAVHLPPAMNLRSTPAPSSAGDPFLARLLETPAGLLADRPDAYLTLVDAFLKQGRYPEALLVARDAHLKLARLDAKAVAELGARIGDLELRMGTARSGLQL